MYICVCVSLYSDPSAPTKEPNDIRNLLQRTNKRGEKKARDLFPTSVDETSISCTRSATTSARLQRGHKLPPPPLARRLKPTHNIAAHAASLALAQTAIPLAALQVAAPFVGGVLLAVPLGQLVLDGAQAARGGERGLARHVQRVGQQRQRVDQLVRGVGQRDERVERRVRRVRDRGQRVRDQRDDGLDELWGEWERQWGEERAVEGEEVPGLVRDVR
jgi:hypothetical protein